MNYTYIVQVCRRHALHRLDKLPCQADESALEGQSRCQIYPGQERPVKLVYYMRGFATKGRGHEPGVPDQAADQGRRSLELMEILNVDKHFDTSSDFKGVEHYAA